MDTTNSSFNISESIINNKSNKISLFFIFIIIIIGIYFIFPRKNNKITEGMTGGTLTQLMAQDSQDVYLKSNVDKLATGNFDLFWNQPTRVANTFQNRGTPLPTFILPDTSMNPTKNPIIESNNYTDYILNKSAKTIPNPLFTKQTQDLETINGEKIQESDYLTHSDIKKNIIHKKPLNSVSIIPENVLPSSLPLPSNLNMPSNPYELGFVAKQVAKTKQTADNLPALTEWTPEDVLFQSTYNNLLYNKDCIKDPASCGGGSGGFRLGEDFVQSTKAKPYVTLDNNIFYPDSYVGSYYNDNFNGLNITKPYAFMPNSNLPPNPIKMG